MAAVNRYLQGRRPPSRLVVESVRNWLWIAIALGETVTAAGKQGNPDKGTATHSGKKARITVHPGPSP